MNRIRILSQTEAVFPAPFPAAMLLSTSPGMVTDTAPPPSPLTPTSLSTIADVTSPEMLAVVSVVTAGYCIYIRLSCTVITVHVLTSQRSFELSGAALSDIMQFVYNESSWRISRTPMV